MSFLDNPYSGDNEPACSCGAHASQVEHDAAQSRERTAVRTDPERLSARALEVAALRGLFPDDALRRRFLRAVGASTAAAAVAEFLPLGALTAMAQERKPLEKKELKIGFIPITCATPLIMADPLNFYKNEGLDVSLVKTAGWALIRDKMMNKEYDASHMLAPMPLAISLGIGSVAESMNVATIQNINGQAITLSLKHKDKRDPKLWKGMTFAVPFEFSMHNFLLRYYVAEYGLDPDKDIQIRVTPRPRWWPTCVPATSMASSGPIHSTSVRYTTRSASFTSCRKSCGMVIRAARLARARSGSHRIRTPSPRSIAPWSAPLRWRTIPRTGSSSPR